MMIVCCVMLALAFATPSLNRNDVMKDVLYSSISWVESKGKPNAKSRDGSVGIVQIKPVMVAEVNRICKIRNLDKKFTLKDRLDPEKSKEMFWIFHEFYDDDINWDSLSTADLETLARRWNGGPIGHRKRSTKKYWKRVLNRINLEMETRNFSEL